MKCAGPDCEVEFEPVVRGGFVKRCCSARCRARLRRLDPGVYEADLAKHREWFSNLAGLAYLRRQMMVRRNEAMRRRRQRSLGASGPEGHKEA